MVQLIVGVLIFLVGFYCGKVWVTKLAGKTISFSLRAALAILFLVFVVIVLIIALFYSFPPKRTGMPSTSTYQSDTTVIR